VYPITLEKLWCVLSAAAQKRISMATQITSDEGRGLIDAQDALVAIRTALEEQAKASTPNATYPDPWEVSAYMKLDIVRAVCHAVATGQSYRFIGPAGTGKTSFLQSLANLIEDLDVVLINAANTSIENLKIPFLVTDPETGERFLKDVFYDALASDKPKIVFIDEMSRAPEGLANTLMELLQEGSIGGWEIPNLRAVIAADNPQGSVYGKLVGLDFAQADRFVTVELDYASTPWKRALAEKFETTDLTKIFRVFDTLDSEVRAVLNPRIIEFMITALQAGFPAELVLPMVNGVRQRLLNKNGDDVTDSVLEKIASAIGVSNPSVTPEIIQRSVKFAVENGLNIYIQGRPGIGKTSYIKALLETMNVDTRYDSAANLSAEDLHVPFPNSERPVLDLLVKDKYLPDGPWVYLLDEVHRGGRDVQASLMELLQERTLGGQETNIVCTIALNNPREVHGFKLDVGKTDLAVATRFALSIEIDADHIPSPTYLRDKYGEEYATPFIEWWEDDLDDVGRVLCTPRTLERLIELHLAGNPLQWGLAHVKGEYVGVPLVDLNARLDKQPMARLKAIVDKVDWYADELAKGKDESPMEHAAVFWAFAKADLKQLRAARDVCVRLFGLLDRQHKLDLIREGGERQTFWHEVLTDTPDPTEKK